MQLVYMKNKIVFSCKLSRVHVFSGKNDYLSCQPYDCSFNGRGCGHCETGGYAGTLSCNVSGQPPATLAEFSIDNSGDAKDYYDISLIDGFNLAMNFSCSTHRRHPAVQRSQLPGTVPLCKSPPQLQRQQQLPGHLLPLIVGTMHTLHCTAPRDSTSMESIYIGVGNKIK